MSEQVLDRLILCASARKISTTACIKRETQWRLDYAEKFGPTIVAILLEHFPLNQKPAPATSTTNNTDASIETTVKPKRVMTCSVCGGKGHNRTFPFI